MVLINFFMLLVVGYCEASRYAIRPATPLPTLIEEGPEINLYSDALIDHYLLTELPAYLPSASL